MNAKKKHRKLFRYLEEDIKKALKYGKNEAD